MVKTVLFGREFTTSTTINRLSRIQTMTYPASDNGQTARFVYGANRNRIRQINEDKTVYYINAYFKAERDHSGQWTDVHYIKAGDTTVAQVKHLDLGDGTYHQQTHYLHRDHLGSLQTLTDEQGQVQESFSDNPHGQRRHRDWREGTPWLVSPITSRGFSGHEHLDNVGLIHMTRFVWNEPEPL